MPKGKNKTSKGGNGRTMATMSVAEDMEAETNSNQRYESDKEELEEEQTAEDDHPVLNTADPPGARQNTTEKSGTAQFEAAGLPTARQNAQVKTGTAQCETSALGEIRETYEKGQKEAGVGRDAAKLQRKSTSFAGLFSGNRKPSEGSKLEYFEQEGDTATIELEDLQESDFQWERCLIGYFNGRYPGNQALRQIMNSWKVPVTVKQHGSGWLIFQFCSGDDKAKVLESGPYIIYGKPLLLKPMPRLFRFGNETISSFPVWVQLRYVPLDMWNATIFGKICSLFGKPIHMDKMTTQKDRVTYARCLVEIDMTKEIKHKVNVNLNFAGGGIYEQPIFYENLPRFCTHCKTMGHSKEGCKANKDDTILVQPPQPTETGTEKEKHTMTANAEASEAGTKKGNQTEWVTKKSRAEKGQNDNTEVRKTVETQIHNQFSALEVIPEADGNQSQESGAEETAMRKTVDTQIHNKFSALEVILEADGNHTQEPGVKKTAQNLTPAQIPVPAPDYAKEESQSKATKQNKEQQSSTPNHQKKVQLVEAGTAKQIKANTETETKTVEKSGPIITEKKTAAQPPGRSITAILAARNSIKHNPSSSYNPAPIKGGEPRKKKDKKGPDKNNKIVSFEKFCAEMGGDSPIQLTK